MNLRLCASLALSCCLISGCTLGPKIGTEVVILRPGDPVRLLENRKLKGQSLRTRTDIEVDVGGWVAMPPEHFEELMKAVE